MKVIISQKSYLLRFIVAFSLLLSLSACTKTSLETIHLAGTYWVRVDGEVKSILFHDGFCQINSSFLREKPESTPYSLSRDRIVKFDGEKNLHGILTNKCKLILFYEDKKIGVLKLER
ncbi:MAG: hypothetical protein LKI53_01195 [Bacteroidales bacterium]|jgi:hypothetical protein|nr:hypothetical protein [Bacteroidales bacterium]